MPWSGRWHLMLGSLKRVLSQPNRASYHHLNQAYRNEHTFLSTQRLKLSRHYTTSPLASRPVSHPELYGDQPPERQKGPFIHDYTRAHFISTLDHTRLIPSDHHDISANPQNKSAYPHVPLCPSILWPELNLYEKHLHSLRDGSPVALSQTESPLEQPNVGFVFYAKDRKGHVIPFPDDTSGFFYYHKPATASAIAGQIRFRVTSTPDPASWTSGHDLQNPRGLTWEIPLAKITDNYPRLIAIRTLLLHDGLVSPETVNRCELIADWRRKLGSNMLLSHLGESFLVRFSAQDRGRFAVIGRDDQKFVKMRSLFRDMRYPRLDVYTGTALCQFEHHTGTGRRRRRTRNLVLRVLEITEPVSCLIPDYDGQVNEPKAGDLLQMGLGDDRRPWMYNVDTRDMVPRPKPSTTANPQTFIQELDGLKLLFDYHSESQG